MKVWIDTDEWYPFYELHNTNPFFGEETTVSAEFMAKHNRIMKEFRALQIELRELEEDL